MTTPLTEPPKRTADQPPTKAGGQNTSEHEPPWMLFTVVLAVGVALLILYGWSVHFAALLLIEVLLGVSALVVGGLVGFLFGIPRAAVLGADGARRTQTVAAKEQKPDAANPRSAPGDGAPGGGTAQGVELRTTEGGDQLLETEYRPPTNLEQVADWLTKILVGVGLVELRNLGDALARSGDTVARAVGGAPAGVNVVTQLTMITFFVLGFLASYLWTRIYYGAMQTRADVNVWQLVRLRLAEMQSVIRSQGTQLQSTRQLTEDMASGSVVTPSLSSGGQGGVSEVQARGLADERQEWPEPVREAVAKFEAEPVDWNTDPVRDLFQDAPQSAGGRTLEGQVTAILKDGVVLSLTVKRNSGPALTGDVTFLLHPTFRDRLVGVASDGVSATTKVYAAGWFTVGAILDAGRTVLALDLRTVPGVPDWFRKD